MSCTDMDIFSGVDFGAMDPYEIEAANKIAVAMVCCHFSKGVVDKLVEFLRISQIVEDK